MATGAVVPPGPAFRPSNAWIWWLVGGCATLIVLVIAGLAFGAFALFNHLRTGGFTCLPSDFPVYPGATFAGENYNLNAPTPGSVCRRNYTSKDSVAAIQDFYDSHLNKGDWQVVSESFDPASAQISFRSTKKAKTNGSVHLTDDKDGHTTITIELYSG